MHMADALLSPAVGTTFWAATIGAIGYASGKLKQHLDERMIPLMGVLGAFVFAGQMINFTIPGTGSSGHLGGGMLLAAVLGPQAALLAIASVLTVQALFFADGGLLALGCNIWNLGVYPAFIAYPFIYRPLAGSNPGNRRILLASVVSAVAALQMGAFSVVIQTLLSGRSDLPMGSFLLLMQPIHLAIGIVEGIVTAGVLGYLRGSRPEILESASSARYFDRGVSIKRTLAVLMVLALFTAGLLSWFASTRPDGLEWSIERASHGMAAADSQEAASTLETLQEKTAILPDYGFRSSGENTAGEAAPSWPDMDPGRSTSGITGSLIVLAIIVLIGMGIRAVRARRPARDL